MTIRGAAVTVGILFLVGCGSTQSVKKSMTINQQTSRFTYRVLDIEDPKNLVPEHMRVSIVSYLKKDLQSKGMLPNNDELATRHVRISVLSYRMRSGFSRQIFGIFAGKDGISTDVTVIDPLSGEVLGESEVSCYNLAAVGGEEDIARMQGEEIAKYLSGQRNY